MTDDGARARDARPRLDGEPALLLTESLIHELVAREIIDRDQAIEIVATAIEAQVARCDDRDEDLATSPSIAALARIRESLGIDGQAPGADGFDPLPPRDEAHPFQDGKS